MPALHQRTRIRRKVRELLEAAATSAGERVYATRRVPYRRGLELPVLAVYTLEESVDPDSRRTAPRELYRELELVIEGWVQPGDGVDDRMDALALEIEKVLHADPHLADTAADSILEDTVTDVIVAGEQEIGLVMLTYAVRYNAMAFDAPEDLDDFETVEATHNLGGEVHEDDAAVDVFDVQEAS